MPEAHALTGQICHAINTGLMALNREQRVTMWNRWLERHSDIAEAAIAGQAFAEAFPSLVDSRVHSAIKAALEQGLASTVSQSLNQHPFPLYVQANRLSRQPMQQAISVMPLAGDRQRHCLVQIQDVTAAVNREQELQRITHKLVEYSYQDGLTGIANRRAFDHQYELEFRRATREGRPLAVALLDVDHFKDYNDHHGHLGGDECLQRIAAALRRTLQRPGDLVARYGGEEFAVLMPYTDRAGAMAMGWSLCREIIAERIGHPASPIAPHVTVSVGAASLAPIRGSQQENLLRLADQALYRAKHAGRNQACVIDELEALDGR